MIAQYGGSEDVLLELHRMFPDAPLYTAVFDPSRNRDKFTQIQIRTSFIQHIPLLGPNYEAAVPLLPFAYENFDLRGFDLVLSSCHACSKGVIPPPGALHVSYCYTPIRYAWSHREDYLARIPLRPVLSPVARVMLGRLRQWDYIAAQRVDTFIAASEVVRKRIAKYYRRQSEVVHCPINLDRFRLTDSPDGTGGPYLVVSRLVQYKRTEVAVEACTRLGLPLIVIGQGPEMSRLQRMAGPKVRFLGEVEDRQLELAYRDCRALIYTPEEDLGLAPIEAMASGRPVLALNAGGARETVLPGVTGELYEDAGVEGLVEALQRFRPESYSPATCRARAEEFSPSRFRAKIRVILERELGRALQ
jgi:glycosyltransferase involved in cell wall biosynthesis